MELVDICETQEWIEQNLKGIFRLDGLKNGLTFSESKFEIEILKGPKLVYLGIHQEDKRTKGVAETRPYLDIGRIKDF